jgi:hypothetical protein
VSERCCPFTQSALSCSLYLAELVEAFTRQECRPTLQMALLDPSSVVSSYLRARSGML